MVRRRPVRLSLVSLVALSLLLVVATAPVTAQEATQGGVGQAFCDTRLADTLLNMIDVVRLAGPMIGGVVAVGAVVALPVARRSDIKRELKTVRNQGVLWGVIVAPLSITIVEFILNNVVVGAATCGF